MDRVKTTFLLFVLCSLLIHEVEINHGLIMVTSAPQIDCASKCEYRCSEASRQKICIRACNTCCERCNCVPPGTYGHKEVCPCYANMTTHDGRPKCP